MCGIIKYILLFHSTWPRAIKGLPKAPPLDGTCIGRHMMISNQHITFMKTSNKTFMTLGSDLLSWFSWWTLAWSDVFKSHKCMICEQGTWIVRYKSLYMSACPASLYFNAYSRPTRPYHFLSISVLCCIFHRLSNYWLNCRWYLVSNLMSRHGNKTCLVKFI